MKKLSKIILPVILLFVLSVSAQAKEVFLCMQNESNIAISADENGILEYISMTDSNGVKVIPQISGDGNTYLPFRFVCEMAGFSDAEKEGREGDYFRFINSDPNANGSKQKIEICKDGNIVSHEIGVEFSYEVSEGDVRNVCIYNIEGSLYFPMTYMTKITDARTFWCERTGDIIFATSKINTNDYIDSSAMLFESAKNKGWYYPNLDENSIDDHYISSGGTVKELQENAKDVYRIKNTLYFINELSKLATKDELTGETKDFQISDASGNTRSIFVRDFVIVKNKIYGIELSNSRLFISNTDGSEFCYLTEGGVYNLFFRQYQGQDYIYYCDVETKSQIHMIQLSTLDDYNIEITDFAHNSLLSGIKNFEVEDKLFRYINEMGQEYIINLPDPLEEFEIARIGEGEYSVVTAWE